ncbi:FecCD family ABC transporter permease [Mycoplasma sp. P36-A1]|uniref:FecCD family ABC transporter permease n=1 Tax=Mycoplasma sp. P36-A1 TaxID=3252900 RepID=UPI003C2DC4E6
MNKDKYYKQKLIIGSMLVVLLMFIATSIGTSKLPIANIMQMLQDLLNNNLSEQSLIVRDIVFSIRLPKVLLAIVIGAALSCSGLTMQAVVKNPLADPYILGISSGAALGATLAIMLGFVQILGSAAIGISAFVFALLTAFIIIVIANKSKNNDTALILVGVAIASLSSAISNFIIFISNDSNATQQLVFWTMGSLNNASYSLVLIIFLITTALIIFLQLHSRVLDLMLIPDSSAQILGFDLGKYRILFIAIVSLLTGLVVYACGIIPFVGLIVPHIARSICSNIHKKLIPLCAIMGAGFVLLADIFSRSLITYTQIPIGILISCVGAPIFIISIVKKQQSRWWNGNKSKKP